MANTPLTDDQLQEIDDALLTGSRITADTATAVARRYGISLPWDSASNVPVKEQVSERYNHPTVGPTGRRALDALNLWVTLSAVD